MIIKPHLITADFVTFKFTSFDDVRSILIKAKKELALDSIKFQDAKTATLRQKYQVAVDEYRTAGILGRMLGVYPSKKIINDFDLWVTIVRPNELFELDFAAMIIDQIDRILTVIDDGHFMLQPQELRIAFDLWVDVIRASKESK